MKVFKSLDITDMLQVSVISYAVDLAQKETLEIAIQYLEERYESVPHDLLQALYRDIQGKTTTLKHQEKIDLFRKVEAEFVSKFYDLEDKEARSYYPDDFNPDIYGL